VRWWRSLHQVQSTPQTLDPNYTLGLRLNALAFLLVFVYLVGRRYHLARVERLHEEREAEISLAREEAYV
jgi:heme exporter protein C